MKLTKLELTSFRQYKHKVFEFSEGITSIVGSNGSGKSTIIEAIGYALFGSPAIRGTVKDAVSLAGGNLKVDLVFELDGEFSVSRTTTKASLVGPNVNAEGTTEVNRIVKELLGMDYMQFCNSFMTNQKALKFLDISPDKRRSTVMSILGLDKIVNGLKRVSKDVSEQTALVKGMGSINQSSKEILADIAATKKELSRDEVLLVELGLKSRRHQQFLKNSVEALELKDQLSIAREMSVYESIDWKGANEKLIAHKRSIDAAKKAEELRATALKAIEDLEGSIERNTPTFEQMKKQYELQSAEQKRCRELREKTLSKYHQIEAQMPSLKMVTDCPVCERPFSEEDVLTRTIALKRAIKLRRKLARAVQKSSHYMKTTTLGELVDKIKLFERKLNECHTKLELYQNQLKGYHEVEILPAPSQDQLEAEKKLYSYKKIDIDAVQQKLDSIDLEEHENVTDEYNECSSRVESNRKILTFLNNSLEKALEYEAKIGVEKDRLTLLETTKKALKEYADMQTTSIAPDLATKSTGLMNLLLEGKYDSIRVSEDLQADIYRDDTMIPLLSGGEEDIISLCLRLALSEMISERTGNTLSLLILDEVFSAMDKDKRILTMEAIGNLRSKFPQILVISHIDDIQEMADNQIRL